MSLHQIMYISSATGPVSATQCAAIAKDAEDRNRVDGVRGLAPSARLNIDIDGERSGHCPVFSGVSAAL